MWATWREARELAAIWARWAEMPKRTARSVVTWRRRASWDGDKVDPAPYWSLGNHLHLHLYHLYRFASAFADEDAVAFVAGVAAVAETAVAFAVAGC